MCLWNALTASSVPTGLPHTGVVAGDEFKTGERDTDRLIKNYADHGDSVCGLSWSANHAWCFASLSRDGRVSVTQVPSSEKYRILL